MPLIYQNTNNEMRQPLSHAHDRDSVYMPDLRLPIYTVNSVVNSSVHRLIEPSLSQTNNVVLQQ
ncbi:hypothetical protein J6590_043852 [Homalodisca vitripennis]|nr:hypothetical protein J6590_043852 [Homalodisca vitripennis]